MTELEKVVQRAKSDIAKKYVFVHMPIPQLETLLAGLEALQEYADDEGMRVSDAIAERDGWEKEVERLRAEHTAMKAALEWINDYRETLPASVETYQLAEAFLMAEDKASYVLSTLSKEEPN